MAVVAVAATGAFFSDSETSTGNTFQAGALDLKVDSECHYYQGGVDVGCFHNFPDPTPSVAFGGWQLDDLTTEKFFWFDDVKPGDYGENTISLHVYDNDAWVCMDISQLQNDDNGLTDPESDVDGTDGAGNGELAQNLNFFAWLDQGSQQGFQCPENEPGPNCTEDSTEGDNIWQGDGTEPHLFSNVIGPASNVLDGVTYALADSTTGVPFIGSHTYYLGVAWCAGNLTQLGGGNLPGGLLNCDGSTLGNVIQTDSLTADLTFRAEQYRNNPTFNCQDPHN